MGRKNKRKKTRNQFADQAGRDAFVAAKQEFLSAVAWDGYTKHGRGAICVIPDNPKKTGAAWKVGYTTLAVYQSPPVGEISKAMIRLCQEYDPTAQFIVEFLYWEGEHEVAHAKWGPPILAPPQAYEKHKAVIDTASAGIPWSWRN